MEKIWAYLVILANHFNSIIRKSSLAKVWLALLGLKVLLAYFLPLSFDEAYYWVWSHHLQLSYFDHPPMIAWILSLGHPFENLGYLIRFPIVLLGHLTALMWVLILREISQKKETPNEILYLLITSSCLFLGTGSLIATPDVPLNFFWAASLLLTLKLLNTKNESYAWLLGASLGLGFLSKYHIVLLPLSLLVGVLFSRQVTLLRLRWIFQIFIAGLIASLPVLIWNYQNDWISFKFQLNHGLQSESKDPRWILEYLLGQIFFIGPVSLYLFLKERTQDSINRMLIYSTAAFVLLFFFITSFRAPVEPNWPIMAYFPLFLIIFQQKNFKLLFYQAAAYVALLVVSLVLLFNPKTQLSLGKMSEPFEYKSLVPELAAYSPLYASKYQMASVLWFELKRPVYKVPEISRYDFFESLHPKAQFPKKFFVLIHDNKKLPLWLEAQQPLVTLVKEFHERLKLVEVRLP